MPMNHLAIIGNGAWGSALAIAFAPKVTTLTLIGQQWSDSFISSRTHPVLGVALPDNVVCTTSYDTLNHDTSVLIATPSSAFIDVVKKLVPIAPNHIAWATKGLHQHLLLHEHFEKVLPDYPSCVISGPSFAKEVAQQQPTALVVASAHEATRTFWAELCSTHTIKPYVSSDVIGVELGGALKNIYAIAAGITSGLGLGTNSLSALITRSLAEMTRFALCFGATEQTFMGLSGLGDLTLTCYDDASRNRRFGKYISQGYSISAALDKVNATVEGLVTLEAVITIAEKQRISMPIAEHIYAVTSGAINAKDAMTSLLARDITTEYYA